MKLIVSRSGLTISGEPSMEFLPRLLSSSGFPLSLFYSPDFDCVFYTSRPSFLRLGGRIQALLNPKSILAMTATGRYPF